MIKGKALFITGIIIIACVGVTGYQFKDINSLLNANSKNPGTSNFENSDKAGNQKSSNNLEVSSSSKNDVNQDPQTDIKRSDSKSIASKYIEEPDASAGTPKKIKIGGKQTDVVPVMQDGKQVGEIHIDPETGKNVGGGGGAPS